ncbi:MAG: LytTR family DNA-binding domain-containing protein [Lachnospiraceae bacterium]|nr:LytTR family DNA-binding domain-containing protein [Lachnospiraceae bacterium]
MQIEVKINASYEEPKIILLTAAMTEEVTLLLKKLSEASPRMLVGSRDSQLTVLEPEDLLRIYANSGKVFAVTEQGEYVLRLRLYELEERLSHRQFVRISNSEIVNLKKVKSFDLSFAGTICVKLSNGTAAYVSRRYVPKIKQILGI